MILEKNMFVERVLPNSVIRKLGEEEMAVYRKPFALVRWHEHEVPPWAAYIGLLR